jgi:7-cyano-7-deazaguanine synthase
MKKAVVLLSGGLDSTVILAHAIANQRECLAISFNYGQRHQIEIEYAKRISAHYKVEHKVIVIDASIFSSSSLVSNGEVPKNRNLSDIGSGRVPSTYVPARNTLFLAYAMGQAEVFQADEIYAGPNKMDVGYPDCRPPFIAAMQGVMNVATKQAVEGQAPKLVTPLINMNKTEIIQLGMRLNVPFEMTFSCYSPSENRQACGACDACLLREDGFSKALTK